MVGTIDKEGGRKGGREGGRLERERIGEIEKWEQEGVNGLPV